MTLIRLLIKTIENSEIIQHSSRYYCCTKDLFGCVAPVMGPDNAVGCPVFTKEEKINRCFDMCLLGSHSRTQQM